MKRIVFGILILFSFLFWIIFRFIAVYIQNATTLAIIFFIIFILSVLAAIAAEVVRHYQKRRNMD